MTPSAETTKTTSTSANNNALLNQEEAEAAIGRFQQFVRYETVSALSEETGEYVKCAEFLVQELESLQVLDHVHCLEGAPDHSPVVVAHWKGQDPTLPILLLNSHYDVVPAAAEDWSVPPFAAQRKEGRIYGRGTQDMKCVCMQYMEAIRVLVRDYPDWKPARTIYLTFVPDEEVGGGGMACFLESKLYQEIQTQHNGIALALDEGLASETSDFAVFYGERLPWWIDVKASGPTGHGSRFIENTAVEQLVELSNKALQFRQGQKDQLGMSKHENCTHAVVAKKNKTTLGDVTSLNITSLKAGVYAGSHLAYNCVPPTAECTLDIRISPHVEPSEIGDMLDLWCQQCSKDPSKGSQVTWKYSSKEGGNRMGKHATTSIDTTINPWYKVFANTLETQLGIHIVPQVFPAATDSRFLRALGIRALGFSPMRNTEIKLHEIDEYITEDNFLEGIAVYVQLVQELGSQGKDMDAACAKAAANGNTEPDAKKHKTN